MTQSFALALLASFAIARSTETRNARANKHSGETRPCL